jgi:hypothetical protein
VLAMSIKERPLIKAVEKLGPLPGFLFGNPYMAGFIAVSGCVLFGAVFMLFWGGTFAGSDMLAIFHAIYGGGGGGLAVGAILLIITAFRAVDGPEETADRIKFVLGGVAAIAFFVVLHLATYEFLKIHFENAGPFMCSQC